MNKIIIKGHQNGMRLIQDGAIVDNMRRMSLNETVAIAMVGYTRIFKLVEITDHSKEPKGKAPDGCPDYDTLDNIKS